MAKFLWLVFATWFATGATSTDRVIVQTTPTRDEPAHAIVQRSDGTIWMMSGDRDGRLTDDYQIGTAASLPQALRVTLPRHEVPTRFIKCRDARHEIAVVASATLIGDPDGSVDRADRVLFADSTGRKLGRYSAEAVEELECLPYDQTLYVAVTEAKRNTLIRLFRYRNGALREVPHPHVGVDARETDDLLKKDGALELLIQLEESGSFTDRSDQAKEKRITRRTYRLAPTGLKWHRQTGAVEFQ